MKKIWSIISVFVLLFTFSSINFKEYKTIQTVNACGTGGCAAAAAASSCASAGIGAGAALALGPGALILGLLLFSSDDNYVIGVTGYQKFKYSIYSPVCGELKGKYFTFKNDQILAANGAKKLYDGSCKMRYQYSKSQTAAQMEKYYAELRKREERWKMTMRKVTVKNQQSSGEMRYSNTSTNKKTYYGPVCGLINNESKTYSSRSALEAAGALFIYNGKCLGECSKKVDPVCVQIGNSPTNFRTFQTECQMKNWNDYVLDPNKKITKILYTGECCTEEKQEVCAVIGSGDNIRNETFLNQCKLEAWNILVAKSPEKIAKKIYDGQCCSDLPNNILCARIDDIGLKEFKNKCELDLWNSNSNNKKATFLHNGKCCPDTTDEVCAVKNGVKKTYQNSCFAEKDGAVIKYHHHCASTDIHKVCAEKNGVQYVYNNREQAEYEYGATYLYDGECCADITSQVCAKKDGEDKKTYKNSCLANKDNATVIHNGECCSDVTEIVCARKNGLAKEYKNRCVAEIENEAQYLHMGECLLSDSATPPEEEKLDNSRNSTTNDGILTNNNSGSSTSGSSSYWNNSSNLNNLNSGYYNSNSNNNWNSSYYNNSASTSSGTLLHGDKCTPDLILTQDLRAPIPSRGERYVRNGYYNSYTRGIVREADILQKHLNRLGFNAGKVDGIIGPNTKAAILRLQRYLGTKPDGYVGPKTRALLNNSC